MRALYKGELEYHDNHFARFMNGVKALGMLDSTLVVYTTDHGEEFFDHGGWFHDSGKAYEELLRTLMVMRYPPLLEAGARARRPVEMVDLVPTQLEILGLPPLPGVHGSSLMPRLRSERMPYGQDHAIGATWDRFIRAGPYKMLLNASELDKSELYNLTTDSRERDNLYTVAPVARRTCEVLLYEGLAMPDKSQRLHTVAPTTAVPHTQAKPQPATLQRLKQLGYTR